MDNIRVKQESPSDWRSGFEIEEGKKKGLDGKACWDGYKLAGTKKKGGKTVDNCVKEDQVDEGIIDSIKDKLNDKLNFVKHAKDTVNNYNNKLRKNADAINEIIPGTAKVSGGTKKESYNTSDWRNEFHPTEIESIDIIKAEPLVERDVYVKSNRNDYGIPKGLKSDGIKDAGTDPVDVMKKMILGDKAEVKKKKETVAASYEIDVENIMLEFVEEDINLLYENGFTYEEIAEFYNTEEYLTEAPGLIPGAVKGATFIAKQIVPKITKFAFKTALPRAKKDIGTVSKFVRNPQTWKKAGEIAGRANRDFDKIALPAAKGVRSVGNFLKQLPARTYDTTQKVIKGTQKTVKALKSATNTVKSTGSDLVKKTGPTVKKGAKKFTDFVLKTYDKVEKNVGQAIVNRGKQDVALRRFDKAKVNVWKDKLGAKALERSGDKAGDVISVGKKTGDAAKYRKPGDPWHQFMKKRKPLTGVPKAPVDRTNKLLTPGKTTVIDKLKSTRNKLADVGGKLATTAKDKGSKIVSQVRKFFGKKKTNQLTGASINQRSLPSKTTVTPVKPSTTTTSSSSGHKSPKPSWDYVRPTKIKNPIKPPSGSPAPKPEFRGGLSPKSPKATSAKRWMELNKAAKATMGSDKAATTAAVTGGATGAVGLLSKKSDENKTISNTEKKTVDPKKNNVVKNNVVKNKEEKKKLTPTQKWDQKRVAKLKYGKSGSHLSPLEQEMAN